MAGSRTLKLSILADVDSLNRQLKNASGDVDGFGTKISNFGKKAGVALAAAGAAATAFAVKFGKDAIVAGEAAATANARIEQINTSMGLFGDSTAVVSDRLIKLAEATARQTGVDTNSIKLTQAKLLTFKELAATADDLGGYFDRATKAAIDMGAAGFGTAEMNAVQLGKALNDPIKGITALSRSGITFTEIEKERIKTLVESNNIGEAQAMILKAIETQVGGTAEATANATDKMAVGFQQVKERVGIALLPVLERVSGFLIDTLFPAFERIGMTVASLIKRFSGEGGLGETFKNVVSYVTTVFAPILDAFRSNFTKISQAIIKNKDDFEPLLDIMKTLALFVKNTLIPVFASGLGIAMKTVGTIIATTIDKISDVVGIISKAVRTAVNLATGAVNTLIDLYNKIPLLPDVNRISQASFSPSPVPSVPTPATGNLGIASGNNNYITVNGAIDPEGTARTIINVLNNSQSRGTLGAGAFVTA